MALIKCCECGKEISDKATTCVHCGCTIEKKYICPECGEKISSKSKVCQNCGYFNPLKKLTKLDKIFIPIIVISIFGGIIGLVFSPSFVSVSYPDWKRIDNGEPQYIYEKIPGSNISRPIPNPNYKTTIMQGEEKTDYSKVIIVASFSIVLPTIVIVIFIKLKKKERNFHTIEISNKSKKCIHNNYKLKNKYNSKNGLILGIILCIILVFIIFVIPRVIKTYINNNKCKSDYTYDETNNLCRKRISITLKDEDGNCPKRYYPSDSSDSLCEEYDTYIP